MEYAKDHWKILIILGAFLVVGSSLVVMNSATPPPAPTNIRGEDTLEGQVKADSFIPTNPPTLPVTQTPGASGCSTIAVDLVLDTSSSMNNPRNNPRIGSMKAAVSEFIDNIPDEAVFAAQSFDKHTQNVVSPMILKDGRGEAKEQVQELYADGEGGTHTREGLYRAKRMIEEANGMFPGRQWILILLSDGAPNPKSQEGTQPASELKSMGVKIITIGLDLDKEENVTPEEAREHMRDMASSPSDFHDANSEDLSVVYDSLTEKLCP